MLKEGSLALIFMGRMNEQVEKQDIIHTKKRKKTAQRLLGTQREVYYTK